MAPFPRPANRLRSGGGAPPKPRPFHRAEQHDGRDEQCDADETHLSQDKPRRKHPVLRDFPTVSRRIFALIVLSAAFAGCGSSTSGTETTTTTTAPAHLMSLTVFDVIDGSLRARTARVPETRAVAAASLGALGVDAPVTIADGTANVALRRGDARADG